jgi:thioredoxin 1
MSSVAAVSDASFEQEVLQSATPVLVDFWAEWCGPCRALGPIVDELAGEYAGKLKVLKLNVDENPSISTKFAIRSIPTLLFFKNGQMVEQLIGLRSKKEILSTLLPHLG